MSNILSKKILIALIAVAIITGAFFFINNQSQADSEYQYAFFGYTYVDGVLTYGVQVRLSIDGRVHETTSQGFGDPDPGSYNIGHYRDTGEYCLTGTYQDGGSEKRDAHQGNKTQTGTIQQDLYLTGTGPNCIGQ